MKKFHPFFAIGTFGIILIALLHIFLSLALSIAAVYTAFLILYPVFFTFLVLGVMLTVKNKRTTA